MTPLQRILTLPGLHYVATRFGGKRLKQLCFDSKFSSGEWCFGKVDNELVEVVARYTHGGSIVMLGCGTAGIVDALPAEAFQTFHGIDISREAIRIASNRPSPKTRFTVADFEQAEVEAEANVILFSESIYYVNRPRRLSLLKRLATRLRSSGCFIVTLAQPERFEDIILMIRANFQVLEDRSFTGSKRWLLVFR